LAAVAVRAAAALVCGHPLDLAENLPNGGDDGKFDAMI